MYSASEVTTIWRYTNVYIIIIIIIITGKDVGMASKAVLQQNPPFLNRGAG